LEITANGGRLVHDDAEFVHVPADRARGGEHVREIRRSVLVGGRPHCDHLYSAERRCALDVGAKPDPACSAVAPDEILQAGLVERHATLVERADLRAVQIETKHVVADLGEAGPGHQTHIPRTDDCNFQFRSPCFALSWHWRKK